MTIIKTKPPRLWRAGDSLNWVRTLAEHPADQGWVLKYTLAGAAGAHALVAAAQGVDHSVSLNSAATAGFAAGDYVLTEYVEKRGERHTLGTHHVTVAPDASVVQAADTRTHARKVLDAIEAYLESGSITASSMQVGGRRIDRYAIADLLVLRDKYRAEVAREDASKNGGRVGRMVTRL